MDAPLTHGFVFFAATPVYLHRIRSRQNLRMFINSMPNELAFGERYYRGNIQTHTRTEEVHIPVIFQVYY